jgi:hypothetical protein
MGGLASFLDNPFEAELTSAEDITIPTPIAPARPATPTGSITPSSGSWNGQAITGIDQGGNLYGASGQIIGTAPPSSSAAASSSSSGSGRAGSLGIDPSGNPYVATSPGGYSNSVTQWISAHVEDFVFIILGILLIGAGVFSFKGTQTVVENAGKVAGKVAEVAA